MIRPARESDLLDIQHVERRAGERFRTIAMATIADDEPPSLQMLRARVTAGMLWVATTDTEVVGYLAGDVVDGTGHVLQVSVDPSFARQGVGAQLLDTFAVWVAMRGLPELTLTTFRDVPWNAPYYMRLGWSAIPEAELGEGLARIRNQEKEAGLDRWPRVAMRRRVVGRPG